MTNSDPSLPSRPSRRLSSLGLALTLLSGCWGRDIAYVWDFIPEDTGPEIVQACGDESLYASGVRIEGVAFYQDSGTPVPEGACVTAIDPSPALAGQEPTILASSKLCADGVFVVAGIQEVPSIGAFIVVDDCPDSGEDLLMTSATGISAEMLSGLGAGDALTDVSARVVSQELRAAYIADLVGYDGPTDETFRFMAGRVLDDGGLPMDGGMVTCPACEYPVHYSDADSADGMFATGGTANASTSAAADGFFFVPKASISTYTCEGGGFEFDARTLGSIDGYAVFIEFKGK